MFASYHNHTVWSDGNDTVMEMVHSARRSGLREFGISDHFILNPCDSRPGSAVAPAKLGEYVDSVQQAKESFGDIAIRLGLEVDFFEETLEDTVKCLQPYSFDFLIGSVHCINDFQIDRDYGSWLKLSSEATDRIWREYWHRIRAAAETGLFDIIGHFDLPKKFGCFPSVDLAEEALAALDAVAESDIALEINTAGWDKPVGEVYPSMFYLKEARRRGIHLVISADAHEASQVSRHFDRARRWARDAGYNETAFFTLRKRSTREL